MTIICCDKMSIICFHVLKIYLYIIYIYIYIYIYMYIYIYIRICIMNVFISMLIVLP